MTIIEKAWSWYNITWEDNILTYSGIEDLLIGGHIEQEFPLINALVERYYFNYNIFYLPLGEVIVT